MINRHKLVPVSYVILQQGDTVLLQLRQNTSFMDGFWATAAAGHVEPGESVGQAAVREAREELGIAISQGQLLPLTTMHRNQGNGDPIDQRVDFFFLCTQWSGTPQLMEPGKAADLKWFSLDELPADIVPHERYVLNHLRTSLPPITSHGFPSDEKTLRS